MAAIVVKAAEKWQTENGWSDEETVRQVRAAAEGFVKEVARDLLTTAEMTLDLWELTGR